MEYDIELIREVSGSELLDALKDAAARAKLRYIPSVLRYHVSDGDPINDGDPKFTPLKIEVELKKGRFGVYIITDPLIEPDAFYSSLSLYSTYNHRSSKEIVNKLTIGLRQILQSKTNAAGVT